MLLLLSACYLPSAYGLRDDGLLPTGPELSANVLQSSALDWSSLVRTPFVGGQGRFRLGKRVGLRLNSSVVPLDGGAIWNLEADAQIGLTQEPAAPLTTTLNVGTSTLIVSTEEGGVAFMPGAQAGVTASRTVADVWHPFVGVRVNPLVPLTDAWPPEVWIHTGGGISVRPRLGKVQGLFMLDGGWDYAAVGCGRAQHSSDAIVALACTGWSASASMGVTLPSRSESWGR